MVAKIELGRLYKTNQNCVAYRRSSGYPDYIPINNTDRLLACVDELAANQIVLAVKESDTPEEVREYSGMDGFWFLSGDKVRWICSSLYDCLDLING